MNNNLNISPRNFMAVSAMLMLSTGIARAQEAVQVTVPTAPMASAPVAPPAAPTIVLPDVAPVAPVAAPAAPVVAATVAPEPARARRIAVEPARQPQARKAAPVAPPVVPIAAQTSATAAITPVEPAPVAEAPAPGTPPSAVATTNSTPDWALPVGAAATLLVLGGVAFAATRRRRVWEQDADFVPPVVNRPATRPMAERPIQTERPAAAPGMASTAAPTSADDRAALIERMVAAAPDASNPFTSAKARRRRARLIVQSMPQTSREPMQARNAPYAERTTQDHRVLASL